MHYIHTLLLALLFLTGCQSRVIFNIADFGAVPDDGKDDTQALVSALEKASTVKNAMLVFPTGQYDFIDPKACAAYEAMISAAHPGEERWMGAPPQGLEGWPDDKNTIIRLDGLSDFTIDGQGATWRFHGLCQALRLDNCRNCTVRNLCIDYLQPPFMTGRVIGTGDTWIDVAVTNKKVRGGEPFIAFQMYDPETLLPTSVETFAGVQSTEKRTGNTLRLNMTADGRGRDMPKRVKEGYILVMRHVLGGYEPVEIKEGKDVTLENIKLVTGAGMGILGIGTENLTLRHVTIAPKDSADLMSTTADGTHFVGCRGTLRMEHCTLQGEGDDHFNLHGQYHFVEEITGKRSLKTRLGTRSGFGQWTDSWVYGWTSLPRNGESVEFCEHDDLTIAGTAKISSFLFDPETGSAVVEFAEDLPASLRPGSILQTVEQVPAVRISDCRFGVTRSRGVLVTSRNVVVENNLFDRTGGTPIFVCCEVDWLETPAPADIILRSNTIRDCGYAVANEGAAITVLFKKDRYIGGRIKKVSILNNLISGTEGVAIMAQQVDDLQINENDFSGYHPAIMLKDCNPVSITRNINLDEKDIVYLNK